VFFLEQQGSSFLQTSLTLTTLGVLDNTATREILITKHVKTSHPPTTKVT